MIGADDVGLLTGEQATESVQVANKGTGGVQILGLSPALTAPLTVTTTLPRSLAPTEKFDLAVAFAPPGPGSVPQQSISHTVQTDPVDSGAGTTTGHNKSITVTTADGRKLEIVLLFSFLNTALDISNRCRVLFQPHLVSRTELLLEGHQLLRNRVQNALVLVQPNFPRRALRRPTVTEQSLEHRSGVVFHRQRLRRTAP